jgi:hypothetical protein
MQDVTTVQQHYIYPKSAVHQFRATWVSNLKILYHMYKFISLPVYRESSIWLEENRITIEATVIYIRLHLNVLIVRTVAAAAAATQL